MSFEDFSLDLDLEGIISDTILAGQTKEMRWTIDKSAVMDGVDYSAINCNFGDFVSFGIETPIGFTPVFKQSFAKNLYVAESKEYRFYSGSLPLGLEIVVLYNNVGLNDVKFSVNLHKHKHRSVWKLE